MLRGARLLLQRCHPVLHLEYNREEIMGDVIQQLSDLGYDIRCGVSALLCFAFIAFPSETHT